MSMTSYDIAVRLSMSTAGFGAGAGMAMKLLGDLEGQARKSEAAMARLGAQLSNAPGQGLATMATQLRMYGAGASLAADAQSRLATAMGGVTKMAIGAGLIGVGLAGLSMARNWVSAAGAMQDALVQLGNTSTGTKQQLDTLRGQSYIIAGQTQFSAPQILDQAKLLSTNGFNRRADIIKALPTIAQGAEVAYRTTQTPYEESVKAFAKIAHGFNAYSGTALQQNVDLAVRASEVSGMTLAEQANSLRYIMPSAHAYNMSSPEVFSLMALASQTGLASGKGMGNVGAFFRALLPGGSKRHQGALTEIQSVGGGHLWDAKGNLRDFGSIQKIFHGFQQHATELQRGEAFQGLGVQAAQAAVALSTTGALAQYTKIVQQLGPHGIAHVGPQQQGLNETLNGQLITLGTNITSLSSLLGAGVLPVVAPLVHGLVLATTALVDFLSHHQQLAQFVGVFAAVASVAAVVVGGIVAVQGAMALMGAISVISSASIGVTLGPVVLIVLGLTAAITAAIFVWQNWGTITDALSGKLGIAWQILSVGVSSIGAILVVMRAITLAQAGFSVAMALSTGGVSGLAAAFGALDVTMIIAAAPILAIAAAVTGVIVLFTHWTQVGNLLGGMFGWIGTKIHDLLVLMGLMKSTDNVGNKSTTPPAGPGGVANPAAIRQHNGHTEIPRNGQWAWEDQTQHWHNDGAYKPGKNGTGGGGGGAIQHHGPITVGPIHVHGAAHHDPHVLAKLVAVEVQAAIGKGLHDSLNRDSTSITSLMPSTHAMRAS